MPFHQYNTFQYNTSQYNADATFYVISLSESLSESDVDIIFVDSVQTETVSLSDVLTQSDSIIITESFVPSDSLTIQITNKALTESVRINDWFSIKKIQESAWGD